MARRKFSRKFKREAVQLATQRGVCIAKAARDRDLNQTVLGRRVRDYGKRAENALLATAS